jgi:hypothetical protein
MILNIAAADAFMGIFGFKREKVEKKKMYAHEDLTSKAITTKLERNGFGGSMLDNGYEPPEIIVQESVPGLGRYLEVKRILEEKYGRKISTQQMGRIFSEVLKEMPHEKRVRKQYGEGKHHWNMRIKNEIQENKK